jgi:hypothetical protein
LGFGNYLFTALTGAFQNKQTRAGHQPEHGIATNCLPAVARAGADPNDSQTLYNRMFTGRHEAPRRYSEFGRAGTWRAPGPTIGTLSVTGGDVATTAGRVAKYNQLNERASFFRHGVDVNKADSRLQRTPYELALW